MNVDWLPYEAYGEGPLRRRFLRPMKYISPPIKPVRKATLYMPGFPFQRIGTGSGTRAGGMASGVPAPVAQRAGSFAD